MTTSMCPNWLPYVIAFCVWVAEVDSSAGELTVCPGMCISDDDPCQLVLNDTDCENSICCEDYLGKEVPDWHDESESRSPYSSVSRNYNQGAYNVPGEEMDNEYIRYSASRRDGISYESRSELEYDECPGACVPESYSKYCEFHIPSENLCDASKTCCVTAEVAREMQEQQTAVESEPTERFDADEMCPGVCIHASLSAQCEEVHTEYACDSNSVCCLLAEPGEIMEESVMKCTGRCLKFSNRDYCVPPYELVPTQTTCKLGTLCCMKRESSARTSKAKVKFPSVFSAGNGNSQSSVLGHLAMDDNGNVFKVSLNGQISPLQRLDNNEHSLNKYHRVAQFESFDRKVVVYSDINGKLYQRLYLRLASPALHQAYHPQVSREQTRIFKQPVSVDLVSDINTQEYSEQSMAMSSTAASEEIVIPDDDDEPPVIPKPLASPPKDISKDRPFCPGSCMSYFLRFTCFRGHAIYDGFACPGRQLCCAKLEDVESHEAYLKSLSPYFKSPHTVPPRCGKKARRDPAKGKDSSGGSCWMVAIINSRNQYICGGAIIDNSWVLTAAHCVARQAKENEILFVRAGVTNLRSPEDNASGQTIQVVSTFVHHNFKAQNFDNDLALLRLQKPFDLDANVCVVCLPTSGRMPKESGKCSVNGYGFFSDNEMSLQIGEAMVSLADDMDCMTNLTEGLAHAFLLPASSFCACGQGRDTCQGDAGGSLTCEVDGFHELVGLVSWSLSCTKSNVPDVYVKVPAFMGWINQIITSSSFLTSLT